MNSLIAPLAIALTLVFAASAIGKLVSPDRGASAFEALRIPVRAPRAAGLALIALELVTAVALVTTSGWWLAASATLALTLAAGLLITVMRAHRLGSDDDCGCFGEWMPARIGPLLIARNAGILVVSIVLGAAAFASVNATPIGVPAAVIRGFSGDLTPVWAVTASVLVALLVWLVMRASASRGDSGADHTGQTSYTPMGRVLRLDDDTVVAMLVPATRARLAVFLTPGCGACVAVQEMLHEQGATLSRVVDVYAVYSARSGDLGPLRDIDLPASVHRAVDLGDSLAETLEVGRGRPAAALMSTAGDPVGPPAFGSSEISELVGNLVAVANGATE